MHTVWQFAYFGRHYESWKVYNIKVLEQHMLSSRRYLFQRRPFRKGEYQQDNAKPHTAAIITAWLRCRRVRVLNWPAWTPDCSPIKNILRIIKWKIRQRWLRTLPVSGKNGTKFQHQNSRNSYPRCTDVFKLFWKEVELHHGKHAPVPTILRPVVGIKFEISSFCAYNLENSQFKHLLCYLCSIVNKIFILLKKTKKVPTLPEFGL